MALVTLAFPLDLARGKFGGDNGAVLYPLQGRMVSRDFVIPTQANTSIQQAWRQFTQTASAAFGTISDAERAGWEALGQLMEREDRFGRVYPLSAQQAFVSINVYRLADGQAISNTAPPFSNPLGSLATGIDADNASGDLQVNMAAVTAQAGIILAKFSNYLPSAQRNARKNDVAIKTPTFAASLVTVGAGVNNFSVSGTSFQGTTPGGDVGCELTFLSSDYVPGQVTLAGNIQLAFP